MTLSEKIRFIRKQMGFTQDEFAKKLRKTRIIVTNIESGKTPAQEDFLQAVSEFTKIPLSKIKTGNIGMNDIVFTKENESDLTHVVEEPSRGYVAENPAKQMMMQMMMENNAILKEQNEFLKLEIKRLNDQIELMKQGKM